MTEDAVQHNLDKIFASPNQFIAIPEISPMDKLRLVQEQAERMNRPSFKDFRNESSDSWEDFWNDELSLAENFRSMFQQSVIMPSASIQLPIATAYAMIPSAMANIVPILFLQGARGSGKSTLGIFIAALHGQVNEIKGANTTAAALRNHLDSIRYYDPQTKEYEKNCVLVWDDISKEMLDNIQIYSMLKSGYNRKTENIEIAGKEGENIKFKTFSLKVMSSVRPFYAMSKFSELNRRCIVLKFKPFETFTASEKADANCDFDFDIKNRLDAESINWEGFGDKFEEFWEDQSNLTEYAVLKREISKRKKSFKIPDHVAGEQWTISQDLICTGIVTGVWNSLEDALKGIGDYWEWYRLNVASSMGALQKILKDVVATETEQVRHLNQAVGYAMYPVEVKPDRVKAAVVQAASKGELDVNPSPSNIADAMADIGFKLDRNQVGSIVWMPLID